MSLAQVGSIAGYYFFGPLGAVIGGAIGGALDRPDSPNPGDLTGPKVQLGSSFGRPYGRVRVPVSWISIDPEFRTNTSGGGKGTPEPETVSFEIDALGLVCDGSRVKGVLREWVNKKLIVTRLAASSTASRIASAIVGDYYGSVLDQLGGPTQVPAPLYEARVGTANALAYRDMFTREYASINCSNIKTIPLYEVEVYTAGSGGAGAAIFNYTGADQFYVVPAGVTSLSVEVFGGNGGLGGGAGGYTVDTFAVTPGETLTIEVGGVGSSSVNVVTYPDGGPAPVGAGGIGGCGGGGSAITRGGTGLAIAGGGGGGGYSYPSGDIASGGSGGGTTGGSGSTPAGTAATGGSQVAGGNGGVIPGAGGGTGGNGGAGGGGGGNNTGGSVGGGGGGGAWGGGGGGTTNTQAGGGAGGSGYVSGTGSTTNGPAGTTSPYYPSGGYGRIVITGGGITPNVEYLDDVILAELGTNPAFDPATVDVTDVADIEVHSYYAVGSPVQTIPDLCAIYYVDVVPGPVTKFLKKGRASISAIPWIDTGVGSGQPAEAFEGLKQGNNDEISGVVGIAFTDLNRDHNANFVRGDRLITEGPDVKKITTRVGNTPEFMKGRAITATLLQRQRLHSTEFALSNKYAAAEPGDCYTVEDRDGNTYRLRIPNLSYTNGIKSCKWELEDASAYVASGLTDITDTPTIELEIADPVELLMVNLPSLRDDDVAGPGAYAVMWDSGTGTFISHLFSATTAAGSYSEIGTVSRRASVGTMSGALGNWTGGYLWDNLNSATVVMAYDGMTLASSTYAAMYADGTLNVAAIGGDWGYEIVAFRLAPLTATRTYEISSLLRGLKGTEWAMGLHEAGDRFILLANNGILRVPHQSSEINALRYYKAATSGSIALIGPQEFADDGTSLMPFSPYDLRADVTGGNVTITWERRSRLSVPPYADPLLSDSPESYATELRNGSTVVSSQVVSARSVTYAHTPGHKVVVAQRNAIVGSGYEEEITL